MLITYATPLVSGRAPVHMSFGGTWPKELLGVEVARSVRPSTVVETRALGIQFMFEGGTLYQRRAVDGDFVADLADFGVADDEDGKQNWIHGLVD